MNIPSIRFCTLALLLSSCCSPAIAEDENIWPGLLGPARNGRVVNFETPKTWPKTLTKIWEAKVGVGYGSPLVQGDRVIVHSRVDENEVVSCLHLASGDLIWRKESTTPFKIGGGGERHGKGPKSSPQLADGRIFTMSITGELKAWNSNNGDLLWSRNYSEEFEKHHPYWGSSASPIVAGDRVVIHFGGDEVGALVALDAKTGKEIWREGKDGASYSSPLIAEIHEVMQVVQWNHNSLVGVELETGKRLWDVPFPHVTHNQNMPTPSIHRGRIILGAENRGIHCFEPQLINGKWKVEKIWSQTKLALDMSSAVIHDDSLYGHSHYDSGRLFCLNTNNGKIQWLGSPRFGQHATFLALKEHIAVLTNKGELKVIEANDKELVETTSYRVEKGDTWAPAVIMNDFILVKGLDTLTRWSLEVATP